MIKRLAVMTTLAAVAITSSAWAADAAAGKAVFEKKCRVCHGAEGQGNPGLAKSMGVEMKPLGSDAIQKMSDADLKKVVEGGKGKMKPIAGLAGGDADNVIAFLRTLKK